jgi:hypothetical protein
MRPGATARAGLALDPTLTIRRTRGLVLSDDPTFRAESEPCRRYISPSATIRVSRGERFYLCALRPNGARRRDSMERPRILPPSRKCQTPMSAISARPGKHMLALSSSQFAPTETLDVAERSMLN